jgi:hypothetical protein
VTDTQVTALEIQERAASTVIVAGHGRVVEGTDKNVVNNAAAVYCKGSVYAILKTLDARQIRTQSHRGGAFSNPLLLGLRAIGVGEDETNFAGRDLDLGSSSNEAGKSSEDDRGTHDGGYLAANERLARKCVSNLKECESCCLFFPTKAILVAQAAEKESFIYVL